MLPVTVSLFAPQGSLGFLLQEVEDAHLESTEQCRGENSQPPAQKYRKTQKAKSFN